MGMVTASRSEICGEDCVRDSLNGLKVQPVEDSIETDMGIGIVTQWIANAYYSMIRTPLGKVVKFLDRANPGSPNIRGLDREGIHRLPTFLNLLTQGRHRSAMHLPGRVCMGQVAR